MRTAAGPKAVDVALLEGIVAATAEERLAGWPRALEAAFVLALRTTPDG